MLMGGEFRCGWEEFRYGWEESLGADGRRV